MAVKLNAELDAYFNTGDQPSESNFQDLIDSILPAPVEVADTASPTITKAANQGRVNVIGLVGQNTTIVIPTPTAAGEWYKFIYAGAGLTEETENIIFQTGTDGSVFMSGHIIHMIDNPATVYADGDSNELLTLEDTGGFEVNFLSKSATTWYVWGYAQSEDAPVFAD